MRVAIASAFACNVGMWRRLVDEGADVRVWRGDLKADEPTLQTSHRRVGEGIVPLEDSWHALLDWAKTGARAGEPTMMLFDASGLGKLADDARAAGIHVVGGCGFADRLEKDRPFGRRIAEENGVESPPCMEFASIDDCLEFGMTGKLDRPVYWKTSAYIDGDATHKCRDAEDLVEYLQWMKTRTRSDISCILEEALDGFALSTQRWWNGRAWVGPYQYTLERKAHMPGNVGPSVGCAFNAAGNYDEDEPLIAAALNWESFAAEFIKHEAAAGPYDINAILNDGAAKFLEWTPRFGYASEPTLQLLSPDYLGWLWYVATGQGSEPDWERSDFAVGITLTIPPAPWEHGKRDDKGSAVGVYVRGETGDLWSGPFVGYELMVNELGLAMAAPEALIGLSTAVGDTASDLCDEAMEWPKEHLRAPGLQYWAVGVGDAVNEDAEKVADAGFTDLPKGLLH